MLREIKCNLKNLDLVCEILSCVTDGGWIVDTDAVLQFLERVACTDCSVTKPTSAGKNAAKLHLLVGGRG